MCIDLSYFKAVIKKILLQFRQIVGNFLFLILRIICLLLYVEKRKRRSWKEQ